MQEVLHGDGSYGRSVGDAVMPPCWGEGLPWPPCSSGTSAASGLQVSRLGLGTMTWGKDTDEHEARDQLVAFSEAGGTLVDTAAGYTDGRSEELLGSLLGDVVRRDDVVLATKAGIWRRGGERADRHLAAGAARPASTPRWSGSAPTTSTCGRCTSGPTRCRSRRRWRRSTWRCRSGRATYVGVSNYTGWQTAQAATWQRAVPGRAPLASTQVEYSLRQPRHRARGAAGERAPSGSASCRGRRWGAAC